MKKTSKKEASLVLQDKIKSLIIKQNLKSGDLMPTENELIEQLGVSRSSLREAIKSLEALHILDIRHGVGTFVSESSLVPMVLGKISQEQTTLLQKSVANMEKNAREQKFSPKDEYHIHLKLYEPLNNPLLIQYLDAFWQIYQQVEKGLLPPTLSPEKLAMQHRELIDAVEAHDLVRMQRAILQYFQSIRQRLQQGGHDEN